MTCPEHLSQDHYDLIIGRYGKFLDKLNDRREEPVKVFNPLTPQQLQELQLIREVSQELQAKKEEDMRKAAEAKEEAKIIADEMQNETVEEAAVQEPKQEI